MLLVLLPLVVVTVAFPSVDSSMLSVPSSLIAA